MQEIHPFTHEVPTHGFCTTNHDAIFGIFGSTPNPSLVLGAKASGFMYPLLMIHRSARSGVRRRLLKRTAWQGSLHTVVL